MNSTALYRHFDGDGQLLYVGVTNNPKRRLAEHKCRAVWAGEIASVNVKWFDNREDAEAAERAVIEQDRPVFNGPTARHTPTGDAFKDWLASEGLTQEAIAKAFDISRATISEIANGNRKASLRFAVFIEDMSGGQVPVRHWMFGATLEKRRSPDLEAAA